ncbi:hypothetical protein RMATCC62417_00754 [Rhizopus microsporus]|nr:hypothetical protein RMATCC62417_00754 [Rhizopus microsporus]
MQHKIQKTAFQTHEQTEKLRDLLQATAIETILLDACARKSPQEVQDILEALPQLNPDTIRDNNLRTPLHIACSRKDDPKAAIEIAQLLIRAGSDVNNGVGDIDGLQPMHMAVLACNPQCVLMLLHEGANIPASDPFRLTPLLLAKLKMDNLLQHRRSTDNKEWVSEYAKQEYTDLLSITQVLVTHLANKHSSFASSLIEPRNYGISDSLLLSEKNDLNETIAAITDKLALIDVSETTNLQESVNGLIEKVKQLSIQSYV